jgi:hypothetical protein
MWEAIGSKSGAADQSWLNRPFPVACCIEALPLRVTRTWFHTLSPHSRDLGLTCINAQNSTADEVQLKILKLSELRQEITFSREYWPVPKVMRYCYSDGLPAFLAMPGLGPWNAP